MEFMQRKNLKRMINEKQLAFGFIMNLSDPTVAEIAGLTGYDFIRIDCEHVAYNLETVKQLVRAADGVGLSVIVRVAEPETISALLDFGVAGFMIPHVRSARQAREMVELVKYAPVGRRGFTNNGRVHHYGLLPMADYVAKAADETLLMVQIEDREGIKHMEEIIATEGIDLICSGLGDISQSMNLLGQTADPRVRAVEDQILSLARKHGKHCQITAGTYEQARDYILRGAAAITVTSDVMLMVDAARRALGVMKPLRESAGCANESGV